MTDHDVLVRFAGVQKTYDGEQLVVQQLDLDIHRGEFLSLLGPSGSGKTTTLMMLAGFESPTAGEIFLGGAPITGTPPHKRNFGMVFQNYALFPHLTVGQNVAYPLTVRKVSKADQASRVQRALDMVRLSGMSDRLPGQLSGGQQQRVALARALVFEPQLVLMDEPLGALDKQLREHMQIELKELHKQLGVTFVYVTHDQGEALTMADRVAILDKGRILQLDSPKALYETPKTRFVAGFMGETNFIPVRIESAATSGVSVRLPGDTLHDVPAPSVVGRTVAGAQAVAAVRPEQVALGGTGSAAALPATVTGVIYSGATVLCIAQLADGSEMRARLSDASRVSVKSGDRVHLSWPAEALRIYGEEVVA